MDIVAIKTFLSLVDTGNFSRSAEQLNVTQSTVSARIKVLEDALNKKLFERDSKGAQLAPAGRRFLPHALTVMQSWQRGRQDALLPEGTCSLMTLGTHVTLWERLSARWIPWMEQYAPEIALHVEADYSESLTQQVINGSIDIAVIFNPQPKPGLVIEELFNDRLVMVSTRQGISLEAVAEDYIYVDWGVGYITAHNEQLQQLESPHLRVGIGAIGLDYILKQGGTAYFPMTVIASYLDQQRLFPVKGAPEFHRPIYVIYPATPPDFEVLQLALKGLKTIASNYCIR